MNPRLVQVVVGLQWGSEGKGHVTDRIIGERTVDPDRVLNVRVAGPNAGHTVYSGKGERFALRQVPVGVVHSGVRLQIAPGSEVDPEVLLHEIDLLELAGHETGGGRLSVSPEATVILPQHRTVERRLIGQIGSTGKGIGAARADRLMRVALRVKDLPELVLALRDRGVRVGEAQADGMTVVIEGTQGYGLGLHAGYYPFCTSSDCRAVDFLAMSGIAPRRGEIEVWGVARVLPIRVAGNSGPMYAETTWSALGLPEERTTVTNKIRRVGHWDWELFGRAVAANGGPGTVRVALTMLDQRWPETAGAEAGWQIEKAPGVLQFLSKIEDHAPLALVTTGPKTAVWL